MSYGRGVEIAKFYTFPGTSESQKSIMYLSEEGFPCPKGQIMHKQFCLPLTVLIPNVNFFETRMKPENSVDPDQLPSSGSTLFSKQSTCKF